MFRCWLWDAAQEDVPDILAWPELGASIRSWHLRLSREHVNPSVGIVRRPRHFLVYRLEPDLVVVGRLLHDAMELARHLDAETAWE
jgi:toxin ParE1/3/4